MLAHSITIFQILMYSDTTVEERWIRCTRISHQNLRISVEFVKEEGFDVFLMMSKNKPPAL
jgi:hypothetical protein